MLKQKLENLWKDKPVLLLLVLILALGIFVRVYDYDKVGMWNDDTSTVPIGLLWFYHHDYYPGMAGPGEPALGHLLVGAGCMLSGQDFSNVEKINPMYYPSREWLLGEKVSNAIPYCRAPSVLFGIIFLFLVAVLSALLFDKYVALFATAFYAFYTPLLQLSTFIHVDIFSYVFIAASLIFLYLFYIELNPKKEKLWFATGVLFSALAFGTKLPAAVYIIFAFLLLAEKNLETIKNWIGKALNLSFVKAETKINSEPLIENLVIGSAVLAATLFLVFEFKFSNITDVIAKYRTESSAELSTFSLNSRFFNYIYDFFLNANIFDLILFAASLYLIVKLIMNFKNLSKNEKFLLYLYGMFIAINLSMETFKITRVMLAFSFPIVIGMGLALSPKTALFKELSNRTTALAFIMIYLVIGSYIAISTSPHFIHCNGLLENITPEKCTKNYASFATKQIAEKIKPMLTDNETFVNMEGIIFYYLKHTQGEQHYFFKTSFRNQLKKEPTIEDKINYFKPDNATIRYVLVDPNAGQEDILLKKLLLSYKPNEIAHLKQWPVAYIYDLKNLQQS